MTKLDYQSFKKEALKKAGVAQEYDRLEPEYALSHQLIKIRKEAGLTQKEIAVILNTKDSSISRLESASSASSPSLATIAKFAEATGHHLKIDFVPVGK